MRSQLHRYLATPQRDARMGKSPVEALQCCTHSSKCQDSTIEQVSGGAAVGCRLDKLLSSSTTMPGDIKSPECCAYFWILKVKRIVPQIPGGAAAGCAAGRTLEFVYNHVGRHQKPGRGHAAPGVRKLQPLHHRHRHDPGPEVQHRRGQPQHDAAARHLRCVRLR